MFFADRAVRRRGFPRQPRDVPAQATPAMPWPSIGMRPDAGSKNGGNRSTEADWPAPDGPISLTGSPGRMVRPIPCGRAEMRDRPGRARARRWLPGRVRSRNADTAAGRLEFDFTVAGHGRHNATLGIDGIGVRSPAFAAAAPDRPGCGDRPGGSRSGWRQNNQAHTEFHRVRIGVLPSGQ
jgi:hypothetical protein